MNCMEINNVTINAQSYIQAYTKIDLTEKYILKISIKIDKC